MGGPGVSGRRDELLRVAVRLLSLAALASSVGGCCDQHREHTRTSSFTGISGSLYGEFSGCSDRCGDVKRAHGVVQVFSLDSQEPVIDQSLPPERFEIPLAPGDYRLEVGITVAAIDRSFPTVHIAEGEGPDFERTYVESIWPDALTVVFLSGVTPGRRLEIIDAAALDVLGFGPVYADGRSMVFVGIPNFRHPQLVGEDLQEAYPAEIDSFQLEYRMCAG